MPYNTDSKTRRAIRRKIRKRSTRLAPGELETIQAFVNTKNLKEQTDELSTPQALGEWLTSRGLPVASEELSASDLGRALDAREGIRALLRANSGGKLDAAALDRLAEASRGARSEVRFERDGTMRFVAASSAFADVLGGLLATVATARLGGDWFRFKLCADDECRVAFWDSQGTGKWCSHRCGEKLRARAYRKTDKYKMLRGPKRTRSKLLRDYSP